MTVTDEPQRCMHCAGILEERHTGEDRSNWVFGYIGTCPKCKLSFYEVDEQW